MKKFLNWIPSLIMMAVIFVISSLPGQFVDSIGLGRESYHINGHFALFLILCIFYFKATKNILLSIVLGLIYAVLDEIHQIFTPYRSTSLFDIYVDAGGVFAGGLILWKLYYLLPKKLKNWLKK